MKKCGRCKKNKAESEFYSYKKGLYCWCKKCARETQMKYHKKNNEAVKARLIVKAKEYRENLSDPWLKQVCIRHLGISRSDIKNDPSILQRERQRIIDTKQSEEYLKGISTKDAPRFVGVAVHRFHVLARQYSVSPIRHPAISPRYKLADLFLLKEMSKIPPKKPWENKKTDFAAELGIMLIEANKDEFTEAEYNILIKHRDSGVATSDIADSEGITKQAVYYRRQSAEEKARNLVSNVAEKSKKQLEKKIFQYHSQRFEDKLRNIEKGYDKEIRVLKEIIVKLTTQTKPIGIIRTNNNQTASLESILEIVSKNSGVSKSDIVGNCREAHIANGRHIFCYLARKYSPYTLKQIGEFAGKKDHTTVIHSVSHITATYLHSQHITNIVDSCIEDIEKLNTEKA